MKGILFRPEMILAISQGKKTVTRRVMKPQPFIRAGVMRWQPKKGIDITNSHLAIPFARFQVGDVVYIKETWCPLADPSYGILNGTMPTVYKQEMDEGGATLPKEFKWRSPLFMPAWSARYFIKITAVKVERLQGITEEDAKNEGCTPLYNTAPNTFGAGYIWDNKGYRRDYERLWDSINKDYPWESNCWVFVYQFTKVEKEEVND